MTKRGRGRPRTGRVGLHLRVSEDDHEWLAERAAVDPMPCSPAAVAARLLAVAIDSERVREGRESRSRR